MSENNPFYDLFKDLLEDHRNQIIDKIDSLVKEKQAPFPEHVKGSELRKLLGGVSEGWLQSARIHGMPFTKIQGLILYPLQEVLDYLKSHKSITHEIH